MVLSHLEQPCQCTQPSRGFRPSFDPMTVEEHVPLARFSTLHVGGAARFFVRVSTVPDLQGALVLAEEKGVPWFPLGGGANFFCRDEGFPGLVIKMENRGIAIPNGERRREKGEITAEAGALTRMLVLKAVDQGLRGIEHLAGVPGTVGGAVRGNAGAFGMETKDRLVRVRVVKRTARGWEDNILPREQLFFAYRDTTFKRERDTFVVWSATFALASGDKAEGERLVAEDLALRNAKQPYDFPSVGSIFKNPSPDRPAGQLIEATGLKGNRVGGAEVSTKHANFIVNRGGATATDVRSLIQQIKDRVFDAHGVRLEEEIVIL